jgi:hypothetical protein
LKPREPGHLFPPPPLRRTRAEQLWDAVDQLRGWRLCWHLALAAGDREQAEQLARTLTAWLALRARVPGAVPDIAELARRLALADADAAPTRGPGSP